MNPIHYPFILYGEDDLDDQLFFYDALSFLFPEQDFILHFANNGKEVLRELSSGDLPDVLFLDLNMPCQDGLQSLQQIRNDHRLDQLPIVVFSTCQNTAYIKKSKEAGANFYAVKPPGFNELVRIIGTCLYQAVAANASLLKDCVVIH